MKKYGVGVIGCDGFSRFAVLQMRHVPGLRVVAVADANPRRAAELADELSVASESIEGLLGRPDVDLLYVATPPNLQAQFVLGGLLRGMHVLAEKPAAISLRQVDQILETARDRKLLFATDYLLRYNELNAAVKQLIDQRILGELLHASVENYASDEGYPDNHWFWDREQSGGLFVEHGVHFFDLFCWWLGPGRVVSARRWRRGDNRLEDQVACTAEYANGANVHFYHGFHQPHRMDRQEVRLVFEQGDVTLYDWMPTRLRLHAILDEAQYEALTKLLPSMTLLSEETYGPRERETTCHGKHMQVTRRIELDCESSGDLGDQYGVAVRSLLADQVEWLDDPSHERVLREEACRAALHMALKATQWADAGEA
jgi:predicted dehydrogenase